MKSFKKTGEQFRQRAGISQSYMAHYLNISPSLFAMWEQGRRSLPGAAFLKYTALETAHNQHRHSKKTARVYQQLQDQFAQQHKKAAQKALDKISRHRSRAKRLKQQLTVMEQRHEDHLAWVSLLEEQLAGLPKNKQNKGDRLWLELQQANITKQVLKNHTDMLKMRLDIDMLLAVAQVHEAHFGVK